MSHRNARPKLMAPPPPIIHAKQPIRFTASVILFTACTHGVTQRHTCAVRRREPKIRVRLKKARVKELGPQSFTN